MRKIALFLLCTFLLSLSVPLFASAGSETVLQNPEGLSGEPAHVTQGTEASGGEGSVLGLVVGIVIAASALIVLLLVLARSTDRRRG